MMGILQAAILNPNLPLELDYQPAALEQVDHDALERPADEAEVVMQAIRHVC